MRHAPESSLSSSTRNDMRMKKYIPENKQQVNEEEEEDPKSTGRRVIVRQTSGSCPTAPFATKTERSLHIKRKEERLNMNNAEDEKLKSADKGVTVRQHPIFHTTAMTRDKKKRIQERKIRKSKPGEQKDLKSAGYVLKTWQASETQPTVPLDNK